MLEWWAQGGRTLFGSREVVIAAKLFDEMDKPGHHLTVRAGDIIPNLHSEWAVDNWWSENNI